MLVMLATPGSVHLPSPSQLFLTTPNFFGDHPSPLWHLVLVLIPPLVWPALSCPSFSLLCLSQALKEKLSTGQASEMLFLHPPPHPHSYPTPPLRAGWAGYRHPRSEGPGHHPERGGQRGSVQDHPRQLGSAYQQELSPVGLAPSKGSHPALGN